MDAAIDVTGLKRFGVVSDEIHTDPAVAFRVANELGMGHVDLNSLWGKPVTELTPAEVAEVRELLKRYGLEVRLVAGLAFKALIVAGKSEQELLASSEFEAHMRMFRRSIEIARELGAPLVRVHACRWPHMQGAGNPSPRYPAGGTIPSGELDLIVAVLRAACRLAEEHDVLLGLENVRSCYANSGRNTGLIVDAVGDRRLKVVWDPANAYVSGEAHPYPQGYEAVEEHTVHVHAKDARVVDPESGLTSWECIGAGEVEYDEQLKALAALPGVGITLETHWRGPGMTPEESSRKSFQALLEIWERACAAA